MKNTWHIIIKLLEISDTEKMLKTEGKKPIGKQRQTNKRLLVKNDVKQNISKKDCYSAKIH